MDSIARILLIAGLAAALSVTGCEEQGGTHDTSTGEHGHADGDGHDHDGAGHDGDEGTGHDGDGDGHGGDDGHADGDHDDHDLAPLGTVTVGDMEVEAFQGHGEAAAGKELHLVVKLAGGDASSVVRAWIGTDDRYASVVALAEYSAEQGGYELHAVAPDPLPENASWWIEVEMPDGRTHVGSVAMK